MNGVFIHIPKTGGVSIQAALGLRQYRLPKTMRKDGQYEGLVTFGHQLVGRLIRRGYLQGDLFTFAFCRNPYDRAVSLWAHTRRDYEPDLTFLEFCRNLGRFNWRVRSPQVRWLRGVNLDFLGKYETLQSDFDELCDRLSIERRELPMLNMSDHAPWRGYYTDETQAIVRAEYAADLERFGYEYDSVPD